MSLLEIKDLSLKFNKEKQILNSVSLSVDLGGVVGIVGESGSGKSMTALSILQLLPRERAEYSKNSSVRFEGSELLGLSERNMRKIRGSEISFIFQEPISSFNPLHRIGKQIAENILMHRKKLS